MVSRVVRAAGTVPWRIRSEHLEVALVHRPAYDDWGWPKGKVDPGERTFETAVRETWEETGLRVRLGVPLPSNAYNARGKAKTVDYWAAEVTGGKGDLVNEIDDVRWCTPEKAAKLLTYPKDKAQLDAVVTLHEKGNLATSALVFVRHALAIPRSQWRKRDQLRPLSDEGIQQAKQLPRLLAVYDVRRLVSSSSQRCATTFHWAAKKLGTPVHLSERLTEEGFAAKKGRAVRDLDDLASWVEKKQYAAALCTHGPLIAHLLTHLAQRAEPEAAAALAHASDGMDKGEALVVHIRRRGKRHRIIAVEHYMP